MLQLTYLSFIIIECQAIKRDMSPIDTQHPNVDLFRSLQTFFIENVLKNSFLGIIVLAILVFFYAYNQWLEYSSAHINQQKTVSQSKTLKNLNRIRSLAKDSKLEESYRDQLIRQLNEELTDKKQEVREGKVAKTNRETITQSFIKTRGFRINQIQQMDNSYIERQNKEKQLEKMKKQALEVQETERKRKKQAAEVEAQKTKTNEEKKIIDTFGPKISETSLKQTTFQPIDTKKAELKNQNEIKETSASLFGKIEPKKQESLFGGFSQPLPADLSTKHENLLNTGSFDNFFGVKKEIPGQKKDPSNIGSISNLGNMLNQPVTNKSNLNLPPLKPSLQPLQLSEPKPAFPVVQSLQMSEPSATSLVPPLAAPPHPSPLVAPAPVPPVPRAPLDKLTPESFLQTYIQFVDNLGESVPISSKIQDLIGARSLSSQILIQAKAQINSIDKNDDKQLSSFAQALYHTIIYQFINKSNVKSNLERIPPKSRTDQCQKNSINKYILTVNIYRLMGPSKKVWVIVFGKLLKLLEFLYKRKADLQNYHKLELIQNGYIKKYKEIHSKYLCRIDFLIYALFALTSFDPILVFRQIQQKQRDAEKARLQIESWGNKWNYSQFWALCQVIFANKHQSYSRPIVYINLLYTLYPRIYENKKNPSLFKQQQELFKITLQKSKKYLDEFKNMSEVKMLKDVDDQNAQLNYEFDGDDFIKSIKVLDNRIPEKGAEFRLSARDYEARANIFYYFTKDK